MDKLIHQSDEELMVRVTDHHSHSALVELHRRYGRKLLGYFIRMLNRDEQLAQDLVQDVFLKIMEKKHLFDPQRSFYTWIFTIASNHCKTHYRHVGRTVSLEPERHETRHTPADPVEKALFNAALQRSIDELEVHHKTVFVLRYLENFPLTEIAEITGTSVGTVKSRLFYATRKMTARLKPFDPSLEPAIFNFI